MNYKNLSIKSSNGTFYQSLKEPQEGAVTFITKEGDTRYHLEQNDIVGTLHSIRKEEVDFGHGPVELLKVSVTSADGDAQILSIPVTDARGVSDWAVQFAQYIGQLNIGDSISIGLNRKKLDKSEKFLQKVMFVRVDDLALKHSYKKEDVPAWEQKTEKDKITKKEKTVWDRSEQHAFYYDVLTKGVERLGGGSNDPQYTEEPEDEIALPF
jgi:hypothetical protein